MAEPSTATVATGMPVGIWTVTLSAFVIAVLYWARALLIPLVLAALLTFLQNEGHTVTTGNFSAALPSAAVLATTDVIIVTRATNSGDYINGTEAADWNAINKPLISLG